MLITPWSPPLRGRRPSHGQRVLNEYNEANIEDDVNKDLDLLPKVSGGGWLRLRDRSKYPHYRDCTPAGLGGLEYLLSNSIASKWEICSRNYGMATPQGSPKILLVIYQKIVEFFGFPRLLAKPFVFRTPIQRTFLKISGRATSWDSRRFVPTHPAVLSGVDSRHLWVPIKRRKKFRLTYCLHKSC